MATTYNFTNGSISGQQRQVAHTPSEDGLFVLRNIVDFSLQTLDVSETDVARILNIPAKVTVYDANLRCITAETADAILNLGYGTDPNYWGRSLAMDTTAGGFIPTILLSETTVDFSSAADAGFAASDVTVDGAAIGDLVKVAIGVDVTDVGVSAQVTAANTVTVVLDNNTGGAVDLASTTVTIMVDKAPLRRQPLHFASADTIDLQGAGSVDIDGAKVEVTALCLYQTDKY